MQSKTLPQIVIILLIALGLHICSQERGDSISTALAYESFDAIEIRTSAKVEITYGQYQDIIVDGYENRIKNIDNKVVNNKLIIDELDGIYINGYDNSLRYYITIPKIVSIEIPGSAGVKVNNFTQTEDLYIDISGSGDVDLYQFFNTSKLGIDISGSGDIKGLSSFDNLDSLRINISGPGDYSAFQIEAKHVDIDISGSGDCKLTAINSLNINISGSGDVAYKGTPTITTVISGSGDVTNAN